MIFRVFFVVFLIVGWVFPAFSAPQPDYCTPYIGQAEKVYGIPHGLLQSVALAESGKNGIPWPWAVNRSGVAYYPNTYEEALTYIKDYRGKARPDVAVGCMQLHMRYHADAFKPVDWSLHPEYNVAYAARFLVSLYKKHGTWTQAVARYHANQYGAQYVYVCRVWKYYAKLKGTPARAEDAVYCRGSG